MPPIRLFHRIVDTGLLFRRLNITANHVMSERKVPEVDASEQMDLFSPFTALTGYDAVLQEAGRLTTLQKELDEVSRRNWTSSSVCWPDCWISIQR